MWRAATKSTCVGGVVEGLAVEILVRFGADSVTAHRVLAALRRLSSVTRKVRNPWDSLIVTFALLFSPSITPLENSFRARK